MDQLSSAVTSLRARGRRARRTVSVGLALALTASMLILASNVSAAPMVSSVSPNTQSNTAPVTLTITGSGFEDPLTAQIERSEGDDGPILGTTLQRDSSTQIRATFDIRAAAPGPWDVRVTSNAVSGVLSNGLTIVASPPNPTSPFNPTNLGQGAKNVDVVIGGTSFSRGFSAAFSGTGITVNSRTFTSTTSITVNVTIASSAPLGTRNLTITNTDGGAGTCSSCFTVNEGPTLSALSPDTVGLGAVDKSVSLIGTGFRPLGGTCAFPDLGPRIVVTDCDVNALGTQATVTLNVLETAVIGDRDVSFVNSTDQGRATLPAALHVVTGQGYTSIAPTSLGQNASSQTVIITGSGFSPGLPTCNFGGAGVTVTCTRNSATQVTATVSTTDAATPGLRDVSVTNSDNGAKRTCVGCFTVNRAPRVTDANRDDALGVTTNPASRGVGAANQPITIRGADFAGPATCQFGTGITVNSCVVADPTTINAVVTIPAGTSVGTRNVTIVNADEGRRVCTNCFTVNAAPSVTQVNPGGTLGEGAGTFDTNGDADTVADGEPVTVLGSNLPAASANPCSPASVNFGAGVTVNSCNYVNATSLTANVSVSPTAGAGQRAVTVIAPDGGQTTFASGITIQDGPKVATVAPAAAPNSGLVTLTVADTDPSDGVFSGAGCTVFLERAGQTPLQATTVESGSPSVVGCNPSTQTVRATFNLSDGNGLAPGSAPIAPGSWTVVVYNENRGVSTCACFLIAGSQPSITSISPTLFDQGQSAVLTINGSNFALGATVSFPAAVTVRSVVVDSANVIRAAVNVSATAPTGTAQTFTVRNTDASGVDCAGSNCPLIATANPPAPAPDATECFATTPCVLGQGAGSVDGTDTDSAPDGVTIKVTGSNFVDPDLIAADPTACDTSKLTFGTGVTTLECKFISATELSARVSVSPTAPASAARTVSATNPDGKTGLCENCFSVSGAPVPSLVTPATRGQGAASPPSVVITGTNFPTSGTCNAANISFGDGVAVSSCNYGGSATITATLSVNHLAATGARNVTVTNPDRGFGSCVACFSVNPAITVLGSTPGNAGPGAGTLDGADEDLVADGYTIRIGGSNFIDPDPASLTENCTAGPSPMAVSIRPATGPTPVTVLRCRFVDATKIDVDISVDPAASPGVLDVGITNGDDSPEVVCVGCFVINPTATVTSSDPVSAPRNASNVNITYLGTSFRSGSNPTCAMSRKDGDDPDFPGDDTGMLVGAELQPDPNINVASCTRVSGTELTAIVSFATAALGERALLVSNPDGSPAVVCDGDALEAGIQGCFDVTTAVPVPVTVTVTSVTPNALTQGATQGVVVNGTGFGALTASNVSFGPGITVNSLSSLSATSFTANVSVASTAAATSRDVTVTDPGGAAGVCTACFAVEPAGRFHALTPARILDTREPDSQVNHKLAAGETVDVQITGLGDVPASGVTAAIINVTAVDPSGGGFATIYPNGAARPLASNLNFVAGQIVPNLVAVKVGTGGKVRLFNSNGGATHYVFDVTGWFDNNPNPTVNAGRFQPVAPSRILDTRESGSQINRKINPGETVEIQVSGNGGIPATGAAGSVMNVTIANPTAGGFLTVFPTGDPRPGTSNLNFSAGDVVANRVAMKLGTGGKVSVFNPAGTIDVIIDVNGWFTDSTVLTGPVGGLGAVTPFRILDTREAASQVNHKLAAGESVDIQVAGLGGVPSGGASSAVLNVTVADPSGGGFITLFPAGESRPLSSDVNFSAGQIVPNLVVVKLGTGADAGKVRIFNSNGGEAHVVIDVVGWTSA